MIVNEVCVLSSGSVVNRYVLQFFLSLRLEWDVRKFTKNLSKLNVDYS